MEDFTTFEIAKKLEGLGFDESTLFFYREDDEDKCVHCVDINKPLIDDKIIIAPTISQVLKWLRKEKELHIEPCILASADIDADGKVINEFTYWSFRIVSIVTGDMIYFEYEHVDDKRFDSYEQSALAGIEYVLDNFI